MPLSAYNKYFGGKAGAAAKAHAAMKEHYGEETGERVFYATKNKHKAEGKTSSQKHKRKLKKGEFKKGGYDWKSYE